MATEIAWASLALGGLLFAAQDDCSVTSVLESAQVADLCGDLKSGLERNCRAVLSVDQAIPGFRLQLGKQVTRAQLTTLAKQTLQASYSACQQYWAVPPSMDTVHYRETLLTQGSLNFLVSKLQSPHIQAALAKEGFSADKPLLQQGVPMAQIQAHEKALTNVSADCLVANNCPTARVSVDQELDALRQEVKTLTDLVKGVRSEYKQVLESAKFEVGRADWRRKGKRDEDLRQCSLLANNFKGIGPTARISIVGYADATRGGESNITLSERRAAHVARCLVRMLEIAPSRVEHFGGGELVFGGTGRVTPENARKAVVYLAY